MSKIINTENNKGKRINPAPLVSTLAELQKQITRLDSVADEFDIDIVDWKRSSLKTLTAVEAIKVITKAKLNFDIQMDDPLSSIEIILKSGRAQRILVNLECDYPIKPLLDMIHKANVKAGISIDPENKLDMAVEYVPYCDYIQIMTIQPGVQGNPFLPARLALALNLRDLGYEGLIGIDGGVSFETLPLIKQYPIDVLSVGSMLSKANNPGEVYRELKRQFSA